MSTAKSDEIKVRVTHDMKAAIVRLASARGEGESVIVREAIKRYLNDLEPLRETPLPLARIAEECGFSSQSALTTATRRYLGLTPRSLRRAD